VDPRSPLFEPLRLGPIEAAGRVFKTATAETRASEDGFVTDELVRVYEQWARGGTPLIITGNLYVSRQGKSTYRMCGVDADDKVPGLARLAQVAHHHGSKLIGQLNHCGRQVIVGHTGVSDPVSASSVLEPVLGTRPRALHEKEIPGIISSFAAAAERCRNAGFDGVQVHAAHGYLLSQFLTPHTNRRRDSWGGTLLRRLRIVREVLRETRRRTGPDFAILLKLNGHDRLPGRRGLGTDECVQIAHLLEAEGADAIEVSIGHYESGFPMTAGSFDGFYRDLALNGLGRNMDLFRRTSLRLGHRLFDRLSRRLWPAEEGFNLALTRRFKQVLRIPVICVGGFHTRAAMESALRSGAADAISCGRAFIADPWLVEHLRTGVVGPRCDYCNLCLARSGTGPVDCWNPVVRAQKDKLLAEKGEAESGGRA
jgi:2,4-dienoyl-CoA reductase-like NADH-dependent reductase (Old Yellow Enzyme family)